MIASPLRLDSYFFTRVRFEACPEGKAKAARVDEKHRVLRNEKDPSRWMVSLNVVQEKTAECCPTYTFDVEVFGLFSIDEAYPAEKRDALVHANGPAVLYGAVREMVAYLSSRGPHPQVMLNTVTFVDSLPKLSPSGKPAAESKLPARKPRKAPKGAVANP